jgi:hypothetical protein
MADNDRREDIEVQGDPQTSIKTGLKSDAKKRRASRSEYDARSSARPVPGAHGNPTADKPDKGSDNRIAGARPGDPDTDVEDK